MESVTVNARWTLENWKRHHRILVDRQERFVVNLPNLGVFRFFLLLGEKRISRDKNVFQGYDLRVTVPCIDEVKLSVTVKAKATHMAELTDNASEYNSFEIDLSSQKDTEATETYMSSEFVEGRLGQACGVPKLHYVDPRIYNTILPEDLLEFHKVDTVYIHFQITIAPVSSKKEEITNPLETYTQELFFSAKRARLANIRLVMSDGEEIPVHSFILLANREILENIIPFDSLTADTTSLSIPGISSEVMKLVLEFVYTEKLHSVKNFSSLLEVVDKYSLKPLLQYLSNTNLSVRNAASLHRLCLKYNLEQEKTSVAEFVKRHAHQFLEHLRLEHNSKSHEYSSNFLNGLSKLPRFEKITRSCHVSVKATKTWPPKRHYHRLEGDRLSIHVGNNLVTFCFYVQGNGLWVKIPKQSRQFKENHLLVDIAAQLRLDQLEPYETNAPHELRHQIQETVEGFLLFASQEKFSNRDFDSGEWYLLDSKFHDRFYDRVTEVEFSVDLEICLPKEQMRIKPDKCDVVYLHMNDGHCLPVCKNRLSENNSVFKALLFGGLKESKENVISIPDMGSVAMLVIVEFICSGKILPAWKQNVAEVLLGASKYMLDDLLVFIDSHLSQLCSKDNFLELYTQSKIYGLARAEDEIADFIIKNIDDVLERLGASAEASKIRA